MSSRRNTTSLLVHLLYVTSLAIVACVAAQGPVAVTTRLEAPTPTTATAPSPACPEVTVTAPSETYRSLETLARAAARREWQGRIDELSRQLERERERTAAARAAVEGRRASAPRLPTPPPVAGDPSGRPPRSRRSPASSVRAGAARVRLIGSDALVSGTLRNTGDRDASIRLVVELLLDHQVLDRARFRLQVPARSSLPWSQTFSTSLADGTYAARVRLEP